MADLQKKIARVASMTNERKADFFVATDGDDRWSGSLATPDAKGTDGPFASITAAQQAVRKLRADKPERTGGIVVQVRGGTYRLDKPLRFSPEDSGSVDSPVIYMAYPGEKPVISGGRRITGWTKTKDGWWKTYLEDVKKGNWNFIQLFVNGQRRFRPRLPEEGYHFIEGEIPSTDSNSEKGYDRFKFAEGVMRDDWQNMGDIEILCFHIWSMSRLPLGSVDVDKRIATLASPTCRKEYWAALFRGNRFLVENVKEALGRPGQWYLDRQSGELIYIPMDGEIISNAEIIVPYTPQLLLLTGDVKNEIWVEHIQFEGLTFSHSNWTTPATGQSSPQADINLDVAIHAEGARHCRLLNCDITHIGQYAVQWDAGCQDNVVEGCRIVDIGGGGIKLGRTDEADASYDDENQAAISGHNTVRDCLICQLGRIQPAGVGIWIGHSPYNRVENNEIYDLYYSTLSCGWVWGYQPSMAHHNIIKHNHFHNAGQCVLSDMGGTYMLGVSPGTKISCNLMHDINAFDYGGWGVYFDQGGSDMVADGNICYRCSGQGLHHHYGKDNLVTNNIFAFGGRSQIERGKAEDHTSYTFEHNIVYWNDQTPLFSENITNCDPVGKGILLDHNIYYNSGGYPIRFGDMTLGEWQDKSGNDRHSLIVDPIFCDPEKGDFAFEDKLPVAQIDFHPIDTSEIGQITEKVRPADVAPAFPTNIKADNIRHLMEKEFDGME